jgi:hypothetical protein
LLIKGWPERNGAFLNENRRSHQRIEAGKRRSAGALRDASGRYLSSDQPATGQRRPSEQLSQRGSSSRPAQPPTAHRRSPAVVQRSALAGVPGPAQVVAGASTGQRLSSEGPAQPAEQYKTRQDKEESGDCTSSSPSLRSGEVSARTAHSLIALTNESKATARPKPAAKRWPTITDDESRVPTAEESARVRASWMAALSERKGTELDGHDPTGDSRV